MSACVHRDMKHMGSLESMKDAKEKRKMRQEARVALGYASSNSYTSFVLSKLPVCFIYRWTHSWHMNQLFYNIFIFIKFFSQVICLLMSWVCTIGINYNAHSSNWIWLEKLTSYVIMFCLVHLVLVMQWVSHLYFRCWQPWISCQCFLKSFICLQKFKPPKPRLQLFVEVWLRIFYDTTLSYRK